MRAYERGRMKRWKRRRLRSCAWCGTACIGRTRWKRRWRSKCKKQPRCGGAVFLSRAPAHPAARHAHASCCPPCLCVSQPVIPMHFATRPIGVSRCCQPAHTAGLRVGAARSTLCLYAPSTAVPIHTAGLRARASRRPPRRCISPPPSRFILPQSRPPYPVPQ